MDAHLFETDSLYSLGIDKGDAWFVDFYPSFGIKPNEKCDLLFYGQAVNGWTAGFDVFEDIAADKIFHSILSSNRYFSNGCFLYLKCTTLHWKGGDKCHVERLPFSIY